MDGLSTVVFWGSGVLLAYAYLGYPALLDVVNRWRGRLEHGASALPGARSHGPAGSAASASSLPSVTVVVAAHNEQACIGQKVKNLLEHDYPVDSLEVIVVSDGSTDATETIVERLAGPRVRLLIQPARQGKNMALNRGVAAAQGEVLVFTDANAMLAPGALRRLVAPLVDPAVGLVTGQGLYGELGRASARVVLDAYVRYESFLKRREAGLGFVAAADGALYALRRSLYSPLRTNQVHDLAHPIQVALAGRRSAFEPEAFTVEPPSEGARSEFRRQVRIIAQGFLVLLAQSPSLLLYGRLSALWMLLSHRLLRWTSAVFLGGLFVSNLALRDSHPFYMLSLAGQGLFYALALGGAVVDRLRLRVKILVLPYYFCLVSAAGVSGFLHFLFGRTHAAWTPTGAR